MDGKHLHKTLLAFFQDASTLSLATVDDDGAPHAANVNFVADEDLNLYWVSHPDAAHSRHIAARPHVAITAYVPFDKPSEIRGLQAHGDAAPIAKDEFNRVFELFCQRFTYAVSFERRIREEQFYRMTPTWVRWIDHAVNFGFKVESDWPKEI